MSLYCQTVSHTEVVMRHFGVVLWAHEFTSLKIYSDAWPCPASSLSDFQNSLGGGMPQTITAVKGV